MGGIEDDFVRYVSHLQVVTETEPQTPVRNLQYSAAEDPVEGSDSMRAAASPAPVGELALEGTGGGTAVAEAEVTNTPVRVDKTLDVALSGAATVEYVGDPKVTRQISGVGRVKRRDATSTPQWIRNVAAAGIDSGLNSSGKPVPSVRSACTPARVLMSVTRQSRSRSTSMATTSPARSSG